MNTKKVLLPLTLSLWAIIMLSMFTFADDVQWNFEWKQMQKFGSWHVMWQWMRNFGSGDMQNKMWNRIESFFSTWLSDEQKTTLKTLMDNHQSSVKSIMQQFTWTLSDEQKTSFESQLKTLKQSYFDSLNQYVDPNKLSEFEKYTENMLNQKVWNMWWDRKLNWTGSDLKQQNKQAVSKSFKYIKWTTYNSIKSKLDSFSDDQLSTLLTKVDSLITSLQSSTKSNKQIYINTYSELKDMINEKLSPTEDDVNTLMTEIFWS